MFLNGVYIDSREFFDSNIVSSCHVSKGCGQKTGHILLLRLFPAKISLALGVYRKMLF